jgi:hypothetical protein
LSRIKPGVRGQGSGVRGKGRGKTAGSKEIVKRKEEIG